jgi:hypothetical protein
MHKGLGWGDRRKGDHFENLGVEGEDNTKMDLQEVEWGDLDSIHLAQGRVAGTCECGNELLGSMKCGEFLDYLRT